MSKHVCHTHSSVSRLMTKNFSATAYCSRVCVCVCVCLHSTGYEWYNSQLPQQVPLSFCHSDPPVTNQSCRLRQRHTENEGEKERLPFLSVSFILSQSCDHVLVLLHCFCCLIVLFSFKVSSHVTARNNGWIISSHTEGWEDRSRKNISYWSYLHIHAVCVCGLKNRMMEFLNHYLHLKFCL